MTHSRRKPRITDVLESVIEEMVTKGILWHEALSQFEKLFMLRALVLSNGNLGHAAKTIGVHRNTLSKKIREHDIKPEKKARKRPLE